MQFLGSSSLWSLAGRRRRFLWRLRAPVDAAEVRRSERVLASARVFLVLSAAVTMTIDPAGPGRFAALNYALLSSYLIHSILVLMLLRMRRQSTPAFRLLVHGADIAWPAVITVFMQESNVPFFLFYIFVLVAAAYRWGLWETLATALAAVAVTFTEAVLLTRSAPQLLAQVGGFEFNRLGMRSAYLLLIGLLLGYLAEYAKQLQAEKAVITRILEKARVEAGLTGTLQEILDELLGLYSAARVVVAVRERESRKVFLCQAERAEEGQTRIKWLESGSGDGENYLLESPAHAWHALRRRQSFDVVALDQEGLRTASDSAAWSSRLTLLPRFHSLVAVSFSFADEWVGRLFLFEPYLAHRWEELRFVQQLLRQVAPVVYNAYLLRRLRQRVSEAERARMARELHDGAIQSLIGVEMQVDVLRRQPAAQSSGLAGELSRIQQLLREEVLKLRDLMQQMKSLEIDSRKLVPFLASAVERFQRETGIGAHFLSTVEQLDLPPRACRELARVVQEALVNVRKHSRARSVQVALACQDGRCILKIEDDGCGFDFAGRLSQAELEAASKGPGVIRERVRSIAGELTIESFPGHGSRLEITVGAKRQAGHG